MVPVGYGLISFLYVILKCGFLYFWLVIYFVPMGCYLSSVLLVFSSLRSIFPVGESRHTLVVTAVTITKESCKVGLYIMQTVFGDMDVRRRQLLMVWQ